MPISAPMTNTGTTVGWLLPGLVVVVMVFVIHVLFQAEIVVKSEKLMTVVGGEDVIGPFTAVVVRLMYTDAVTLLIVVLEPPAEDEGEIEVTS